MKNKIMLIVYICLLLSVQLFAQATADTDATSSADTAGSDTVVVDTAEDEDIMPDKTKYDESIGRNQSEFQVGIGGGFNRIPIVSSDVGIFLVNLNYNFWFSDSKDDPLKFGIGMNLALLNVIIPVPHLELCGTFPFIGRKSLVSLSAGAMYDFLAAKQFAVTGKLGFVLKKNWNLSLFISIPIGDAEVEYNDIFLPRDEILEKQKEKGYGENMSHYFIVMLSRRLPQLKKR